MTCSIPGPGGVFFIPAEPDATRLHSLRCASLVFDGEYEYERDAPEDVRTLVDVGVNLGAFIRWAQRWWPTLERVQGYDPNSRAIDIARRNIVGVEAELWTCAVTIHPDPKLVCGDNWGGAHTYQAWEGETVARVHPSTLPPCDVLKIDAEGVEPEILENYPHLADVRVCLYEYHTREHRDRCAFACGRAGLRLVKDPDAGTSGVAVWVRHG